MAGLVAERRQRGGCAITRRLRRERPGRLLTRPRDPFGDELPVLHRIDADKVDAPGCWKGGVEAADRADLVLEGPIAPLRPALCPIVEHALQQRLVAGFEIAVEIIGLHRIDLSEIIDQPDPLVEMREQFEVERLRGGDAMTFTEQDQAAAVEGFGECEGHAARDGSLRRDMRPQPVGFRPVGCIGQCLGGKRLRHARLCERGRREEECSGEKRQDAHG